MSNYFIGIGGTGAKCAEALAHLSAAGLMPGDDLHALFVDPDSSNGSLDRTQNAFKRYVACQGLKTGRSALFGNKFSIADPEVWTPFEQEASPRLRDAIGYNQLQSARPELAHLCDVLYSNDEKNQTLNKGFRGHPSIGAAVLANTISFDGEEPWTALSNLVANDLGSGDMAHIFLCGSVFGGTGASGLPNIARLLREEVGTKARIGGVLVLPYFSFNFSNGGGDEIRANSSGFIPNTQSALKYYRDRKSEVADKFDCMYVVGDAAMTPVHTASVGGQSQRNAPHFIELFAGLAALDFFDGNTPGDVAPVALNNAENITWSDLPYHSKGELKTKMVQMARTALFYLDLYDPAIRSLDAGRSHAAPWYVDFFERANAPDVRSHEVQKQFSALRAFFACHLRWLGNLHAESSGRLRLLQWRAFATEDNDDGVVLRERFDRRKLGPLAQGQPDDVGALKRHWTHMSSRPSTGEASGVGAFLRALHDGCTDDVLLRS